ncbi:MAG: sulfatase-like hydrolase/transferase [Anaerolineaceae bacterium]|nr:sulfatase-like hydrolase/transferase [Anaerolineaceae bacterium]
MAAKPNILFIVLDTMRRDRLSIYGHDRETSPQLDQFAQDSTLFERAVSAAQWTVPSHASMFTGVYPSTHGLTQADGMLPRSYPALAEILRGAGYETVAFCNNPLVGVLNNGLQRGFTRFYNYSSAAPFRPKEHQQSKLRREAMHMFRRYMARPIGNQFAHSDFLFRMSLNPLIVPIWNRLINFKGNSAHSIDDLMTYWAQKQAGGSDKPMFAFLNLMGSHMPYNPPQDALDRVAPQVRHDKHAYSFIRRFNSEAARWASPTDPPLKDWEQETLNNFYDAEIVNQDQHLGRLLKWLKDSGTLDNTMVIICADHGEGLGDHDFIGHGFVVYHELVHVPLMIQYPERFPAGKRIMNTISTRRLFHTVLEAADVTPPSEADTPSNLSLSNVANGSTDIEQNMAMAEAFPPLTFLNVIQHRNAPVIQKMRLKNVRRALYQDQHKLAVVGQQVEGLFDISTDPTEVQSVATVEAPTLSAMQRMLIAQINKAESQRIDSPVSTSEVDESVVDHLRALGYIE